MDTMQPMHSDPSMRPATTRSTVIARMAAVAAVIAVAFAAASGAEAM